MRLLALSTAGRAAAADVVRRWPPQLGLRLGTERFMIDAAAPAHPMQHHPAVGVRAPPARTCGAGQSRIARDRVKRAIKRFSRPLGTCGSGTQTRAYTRPLVTDFLCEGLGYDKYEHLTTEYRVKGEFADYGVRGSAARAFIEAQACLPAALGAPPAAGAAVRGWNEGVEWMVLTNGQIWQAYHLTGGLPVVVDLALEVDLLDDTPISEKADLLFYLTLEAVKRDRIDPLWREKAGHVTGQAGSAVADRSRRGRAAQGRAPRHRSQRRCGARARGVGVGGDRLAETSPASP